MNFSSSLQDLKQLTAVVSGGSCLHYFNCNYALEMPVYFHLHLSISIPVLLSLFSKEVPFIIFIVHDDSQCEESTVSLC